MHIILNLKFNFPTLTIICIVELYSVVICSQSHIRYYGWIAQFWAVECQSSATPSLLWLSSYSAHFGNMLLICLAFNQKSTPQICYYRYTFIIKLICKWINVFVCMNYACMLQIDSFAIVSCYWCVWAIFFSIYTFIIRHDVR